MGTSEKIVNSWGFLCYIIILTSKILCAADPVPPVRGYIFAQAPEHWNTV
jgi:hypothetical protein